VIELAPQLRPFALAWAAFAGAAIGSFLNVVIARVPAGDSVVHPRSRCPRCHTPIAWYDNLPVISWVLLRARCRSCKAPISVRYPIVELLGGAAALAAVARHGFSLAALAEFAFVALLIALSAIDLDTWLLPHALTWPLIALGLGAALLAAGAAPSFRSAAYGAGVGFTAFAAVAVFGEKVLKKEAMGWGDVWLLAGLGAFLGLKALLPVVLLASVQGAIVGIVLIVAGRAQPGPAEPSAGQAGAANESSSVAPTGAAAPRGEHDVAVPPEPHAGADGDEEDDWVPPKNAVPFGPFLAAGALEWLWGAELLSRAVPFLDAFR
jgi:leader peptidase (prepilin peptidase)/N-methyltransferase